MELKKNTKYFFMKQRCIRESLSYLNIQVNTFYTQRKFSKAHNFQIKSSFEEAMTLMSYLLDKWMLSDSSWQQTSAANWDGNETIVEQRT